MRRPIPRQVIAAGVAGGLAAAFVIWRFWFPGREFDPVAWKEEAQMLQEVRLRMADRLIAQGTLYGKTRAELVEMLGEPPPNEYFREWDLVYRLGPERGYIRMDSEWLVIRLSPVGRVTEYRIVRD
jgi:hypothetical protein